MTRPTRLETAVIDRALDESSSPWERDGDRLVLDRRFEGFGAAIAFVNNVAALADEADHHPDIEVHYDAVRLALWTHDAGGLTALDLQLAASIAALD